MMVIGRPDELPERCATTSVRHGDDRENTGMTLTVALNYGGRAELVDAFNRHPRRIRRRTRYPVSRRSRSTNR